MSETTPGNLTLGSGGTPRSNCCVMCCGCFRLLKADGTLTDAVGSSGLLYTTGPNALAEAAGFSDAAAADAAASGHGWQVKDESGPNHRCPNCRVAEQNDPPSKPKRRGAYIYR